MVAELIRAFLLFSVVFSRSDAQDLLTECTERCDSSMLITNAIDRDLSCDASCKITSCQTGCDSWTNTSLADCTRACNESFTANSTVKVAPCSTGCTFAQDVYVERIKDDLNSPSPPSTPSSAQVSHDSVVLQWNEANSSLITYLVQWRYNTGNSDWRFYLPSQPLQDPNVTVTDLHAYTTYRFRVLWLITDEEFIASPQSIPIQTLPFGAPSSPPIITQLTSPTTRSVYITWNPPQFPNRPLTLYKLLLTNLDDTTAVTVFKDVTASQRYFQFSSSVQPNTTYSVSVRPENSDGLGPAAVANITTLATNPEDDSLYPVLLMGSNHHILRVDLLLDDSLYPVLLMGSNHHILRDDSLYPVLLMGSNHHILRDDSLYPVLLMGSNLHILRVELDGGDDYWGETEDDILFESANDSVSIIGVAFHVRRDQVYYSDTAGTVGRVSMVNSSDTAVILTGVSQLSYLSVDWLHDRLYYVSGRDVMRCSLDGSQQEVVLQYLSQTPGELLVNPYHGFLYWTQAGEGGGLYRMDLAHLGANATNSTRRIADQDHLQAVTISYSSLRLFFPDKQMNVMLSTFIDGSDREDFHANTVSPQLTDVKSLTHFEESFFWTRGEDQVYREVLNPRTGQFVHNQFTFNFAFFNEPFVGLEMYHPSMQPIPVPSNPPQDFRVLFGDESVFLSWSRPEQLSTFGKGSWQDWRYELEVQNLDSPNENSTVVSDIMAHNHTLQGLEKGAQYSFSVRAYSQGGQGPWSSSFVGRVYSQVPTAPSLVLVTSEGVVQSSIDGSTLQTEQPNVTDAADLAWMDINVYYVTSGGEVAYWNSSGDVQEVSSLPWVTSARAVAVDWIGRKLYWANSAQHRIYRSQLNGDSMEQVMSASVQDLEVNTLSGHLFWTSAHAVERARLNGQDRTTYWRVENFSGRQLAGITLDTRGEMVYWLVSGLDMLDLYQASSTAEGSLVSSTVQSLGPVNSYTV
ncbi:proto-oncogene tyrosine-protein kinase ROS-like [Branchiostoma lanceolatum]|uniref:proto-oncogene tyrosine-protein kinase ROS-like n=1 Tax=Branchiostoma lanceolatum TaxID=7740 RepID=UPI0034549633